MPKKCKLKYLGPSYAAVLDKWGCLLIPQFCPISISCTKSKFKRGQCFKKKIANLCIWDPTIGAISNKWLCL